MELNNVIMIAIFILGYLLITIEHVVHLNKSATAILMAVFCWVLQYQNGQISHFENTKMLEHHLQDVAQIVFFLLGALIIVETMSLHHSFKVVTDKIKVTSKRRLLWTLGGMAFILSAILDNLTTTVVMISLIQKLMEKGEDRRLMGGAIVIAANAGGAWTPIGDVTTTMLWIGGQVSSLYTMQQLFVPSLVCMLVSFSLIHSMLSGNIEGLPENYSSKEKASEFKHLFFYAGIFILVFVPIFKILTGLPPFMGILLGVAILWIAVDFLHWDAPEKEKLSMTKIISHIDLTSLLFFLGILLSIGALDSAGWLRELARFFDRHFGNTTVIATLIGLASAIVDNVPLVAGAMGMYELQYYPQDSEFWQLIAYCAGTGGSILIIGSAAGVVYMGLEKVTFTWYLRRLSLPALIGYFAGIGVYLLLNR